jgi:hypothetical protein
VIASAPPPPLLSPQPPPPKSTNAFKLWLEALDMGAYFASFERHGFNKLNYVLLSTLNDDELRKLICIEKRRSVTDDCCSPRFSCCRSE